jgi:hypothetical protein
MSRYSTRLYSTFLYGIQYPKVILLIDWDNDGTLEANESDRVRRISITRGRPGLFESDQFARMRVGECEIVLDNHDRRFDPWYASSLLHPNVAPGREMQLSVQVDGTDEYAMFRGKLDNIESSRQSSDPVVTLTVSDGWRLLSDRNATLALQTNVTTDVLLGAVLDDVGWPVAWGRDLAVGSDIIPWAWVESRAAYDAIHDMVESEMGLAFVGADGKFNFVSRSELMLEASAFTLDQAQVGREPMVSNPWEFVKNKVSVKAFPRRLSNETEIWRLEETRLVNPGQSVTIWGTFRDSNYNSTIAQNVVAPVATTDYTMNSESGGGGDDLTGNFTVTPSVFAGSIKLVVVNTGTVSGYITLLKVRGRPLELLSVAASISENASSQLAYGKRQLTLELEFQQQTAVAVDMSDWLVHWLASPLPMCTVEIVDRLALQLGYDIGTVLTLTMAYLGLNHRFRIGQIHHEAEGPFQVWRTRWTLEPIDQMTNYWQLGVTGHDELGVNTRLAY